MVKFAVSEYFPMLHFWQPKCWSIKYPLGQDLQLYCSRFSGRQISQSVLPLVAYVPCGHLRQTVLSEIGVVEAGNAKRPAGHL